MKKYLISFIVSVMASVVSYYLCKGLDVILTTLSN